MRGPDSNAWLQAVVKNQFGGTLTSIPANTGMFYAVVVDTDATNSSLETGLMRVKIPQINGQNPYPPTPYPGSTAPPAGTTAVVAFSGFGAVPMVLGFMNWQGSQFRMGSGAPASSLGSVGDTYLDYTASVIYGPKTSTGWGTGHTIGGSGGSGVTSVTAGDSSITIGGTSTAPTVRVSPAGTSGTYGSATQVPSITTDSTGRITSITVSAPLDATKLPLSGGTLTGSLYGTTATWSGEDTATDFKATGLTGATAGARFVGGTVSGYPTTGTFQVGDFVVDQSATVWICVAAGSPGTWSPSESVSVVRQAAAPSPTLLGQIWVVSGGGGATATLPASPLEGSTWGVINNSNSSVTIYSASGQKLNIGNQQFNSTQPYTVDKSGVYLFMYSPADSTWYATTANDIGDTINTLAINRGGTNLTTSGSAGQRLISNGSSYNQSLDAAVTYSGLWGSAGPAIQNFDFPTTFLADASTPQASLTKGTVYCTAIYVPYAITASKIWIGCGASVACNCTLGLYSSTAQLGYTGTVTTTTQGVQSGTLTATSTGSLSLTPGWYYIAVVSTTTNTTNIWGANAANAVFVNMGTTSGTASTLTGRTCILQTSNTTGITSNSPAVSGVTPTMSPLLFWAGIS